MAETLLITGANRGIGLELARQAAARGDRVVATARRPGGAPGLDQLAHHAGSVEVHGLDVRDPDQCAALSESLRFPVDVLVCNAGQFVARGDISDPDYTADAWQAVMMTNVAGPFFAVRAFLDQLGQAARPRVAIVSSVMASSERAPGRAYIYRASKAAATNLARNLAVDLAPRGIAVGAFHPGWVRTDMGGSEAEVSVEESAAGLLERIGALSLDNTGVFEDYRGVAIPF